MCSISLAESTVRILIAIKNSTVALRALFAFDTSRLRRVGPTLTLVPAVLAAVLPLPAVLTFAAVLPLPAVLAVPAVFSPSVARLRVRYSVRRLCRQGL
jgi:hypothetical protein